MKLIIIGAGGTGATLANLLGEEHDITIIEKDVERARSVAEKTPAMVIEGDGTDISVLKDAGLKDADTIIATTSDDKTNLMICEIAKKEKVKKTISLVNSAKNEELFIQLGNTSIVSVVGTNVTDIKKLLYQYGDERIIAQLGAGDVQIIEQTVSKDSKLVGREAKLKKAVIATIYRGGELILPREDTVLEEGDVLLVAVKTKDLPDVAGLITGR